MIRLGGSYCDMAKAAEHTCGSCGHVTSGYTRNDLEAEGWVWHIVRGIAVFVMCDTCEAKYKARRIETNIQDKKGR